MNKKTEYLLLVVLLMSVGLFFVRLGFPTVWNPNEAFYFETSREMLERGDFLTPYYNYEFRFQKPPMLYWLITLSYTLFGQGEFQGRLASVIMGLLTVGLTYYLGKEIWKSRGAGLMSALVMALAFDFNSNTRYASPEIILTGFNTLTLTLFYKWYKTDGMDGKWLLLGYISAGLATLTKGPIGLAMPAMIIIPWLVVNRQYRLLLSATSPVGIAIYLAISTPWYLLMINKYGHVFTDVFMDENVKRFLTKKSSTSNPLFYFSVIPWNFFPGSLFLVPALIWMRKLPAQLKELRFPIIWSAAVFIFFSISTSKLPPYLIPMFPGLAIISGGWLFKMSEEDKFGKTIRTLITAGLLIIFCALVWLSFFLKDVSILWSFIAVVPLVLSFLKFKNRQSYALLYFISMSIFYLAFITNVLGVVEEQREYRKMAEAVRSADKQKSHRFYTLTYFQKSLAYYFERRVEMISEGEFIRKFDSEPAFFLLKKDHYDALKKTTALDDEVLWQGRYTAKSESRFFVFLKDISKGNIEEHVIIKKKAVNR